MVFNKNRMWHETIYSAKKMKVCFILGMFYPVINGAVIQISLLAERLVKQGISVVILTTKIRPRQPDIEIINGVKIIRIGPAIGVKRIGKYLKILPIFLALLREKKNYDFIVICDFAVRGVLGVVASKILGKRCILRAETNGEMDGTYATQYGLPPSRFKLSIINILVNIRNIILKRADGFISISSDIKREFLKSGVNKEKVFDITNGVDVKKFSPVDRNKKALLKEEFGIPNKRYFLYTGRLARGKGLKYLMQAWLKMVSEYSDIHLFLIGSGQGYALSCEEELKDFIKENKLNTTVNITGNVNNVREYLQAGDFYVLPSQSEGLSISLIEALSCGLPCIASRVRGILDVIKEHVNGVLVPYGDEEKLYQAMKIVLTNKEFAEQIGKEGKRTVQEKFNIEKISRQYLQLLKHLSNCEVSYQT